MSLVPSHEAYRPVTTLDSTPIGGINLALTRLQAQIVTHPPFSERRLILTGIKGALIQLRRELEALEERAA